MLVPRAQSKTIGLADGLDADDRCRHIEVLRHSSDDSELLGVLFTEVCAVRLRDLQQLHDDGRDAAEVTGPERSAEMVCERSNFDAAHRWSGIYLGGARRKDAVHA